MSADAARFGDRDVDSLIELLREVAEVEIVPKFRNLAIEDIRTKSGPLDPVTVADEAAELRIADALRHRYPGALIVGEEGYAKDPSVLAGLEAAPLAFVLDPIDGTANFAAGIPLFATMVAVVADGETIAGVIYEPLVDDALAALAGAGARHRTADGREIALHVSTQEDPALMSGKAAWRYLSDPLSARVSAGLAGVAANWDYRCAAYEYRSIVSGASDFALYGRAMPWDHLAGTLLHREAGGHVARFDGSPYRGQLDGGILCAPSRDAWAALKRVLLD